MSTEMGVCSRCGYKKRLTKDGLIYRHDNPMATMVDVECKGSRKPSREMLDKRAFDALVESQQPETQDVASLWDGIKVLWPALHADEGVLVKGMILLECIDSDGHPNFMWVTSPYMPPWAIKGMLAEAQEELAADSLADTVFGAIRQAQIELESEADDDLDEDE